jgi:hypothetical protein
MVASHSSFGSIASKLDVLAFTFIQSMASLDLSNRLHALVPLASKIVLCLSVGCECKLA